MNVESATLAKSMLKSQGMLVLDWMVHTGLNRGANEGMTKMLNTKLRGGGV